MNRRQLLGASIAPLALAPMTTMAGVSSSKFPQTVADVKLSNRHFYDYVEGTKEEEKHPKVDTIQVTFVNGHSYLVYYDEEQKITCGRRLSPDWEEHKSSRPEGTDYLMEELGAEFIIAEYYCLMSLHPDWKTNGPETHTDQSE